ncbi:putative metalloprotease CJM1_0395 family protein [Oceanibaculum nanhaiense]|uniref:putative metalloprotease CJM1_0395 family protein n=1 Tax=Oceanibaculum nanhaiense TaxID=1909734 RepID=UPI00396E3967
MIATLAGTTSYTAPGATISSRALSGVSTPEANVPEPSPSAGDATSTAAPQDQAAQSGNGRLIDLQTFTGASNAPDQEGEGEPTDPSGLTEEERAQVDELKQRDREVRAHEQAHAAVGGAYAGSPSYEYESGPDGNRYAIGGEVSIDASPISGDPEATIQKMEVVKRAALAPAEPSPQDRAVAAQADQTRLKAQAELREQNTEEQQAATEGGAAGADEGQSVQQAGRAAGAYAQAAQAIDGIVSQINIAA